MLLHPTLGRFTPTSRRRARSQLGGIVVRSNAEPAEVSVKPVSRSRDEALTVLGLLPPRRRIVRSLQSIKGCYSVEIQRNMIISCVSERPIRSGPGRYLETLSGWCVLVVSQKRGPKREVT